METQPEQAVTPTGEPAETEPRPANRGDLGRALSTYIKLLRAANSISSDLQPYLSKNGLSSTQLGVLEALMHLGSLCLSEVSRKLLKSSGNITTVVDNLEKRGLVRRERSAHDRRFVTLHLTEQGRELIEQVFPGHAEEISERFAVLSPQEQDELARLCKKLGLGDPGPCPESDA